MATFPERGATLARVLATIAPQLDVLYLYLNGYDSVPEAVRKCKNVRAILGRDAKGDLGPAGKMIFLEHEQAGMAFTLDDDILYPADYVRRMLHHREAMHAPVGLCVHGSLIPPHASWYYERTRIYDTEVELAYPTPVNLVGSGTFCMDMADVRLQSSDFAGPPQVDLVLSLRCLEQGVALAAVPRRAGWLKFLPYEGITESAFKNSITQHTLAMRRSVALSPANLQAVWQQFLAAAQARGAAPEWLRTLDKNGVRPLADACNMTPYGLAKALQFTYLWAR